MKQHIWIFLSLIFSNILLAQENKNELKMIANYSSDNPEIRDILQFEGINYFAIKFVGNELMSKHYRLTEKEIWDGDIVSDSTITDSFNLPFEQIKTVNDTVLNMRVLSKVTKQNKLKMTFVFPGFSVTKVFDAIASEDYRLRNIAEESNMEIGYDKRFYLLAYILPYEREDGSASWCDVGSSGKDIQNWGKKFGIKHYLVFEMEFKSKKS